MPKRSGWVSCLAVFAATSLAASAEANVGAGAALRQYTSGGHVLGFGTDGYHVSNGSYSLRVEFAGATPVVPAGQSAGTTTGGGAAALGRVRYDALWAGISVEYDAPAEGIARSTWHLEPGAEPMAIRLRYNRPLKLNPDGTLTVDAGGHGVLTESAPVAWQEVDGERRPVAVAFALVGKTGESGEGELGFELGAYDRERALVIDPTLLWNTFLGGSGGDEANSIAVDASGNVLVAGDSSATWGSPLRAFTAAGVAGDAFAAKLDANGVLLWHTFLGGSDEDSANGIAVDASGNAYVTGRSGATWGSPVRAHSGEYDAFVAKLDPSGGLQWSTFLGGADNDFGNAIALGGSGNVYVAGRSAGTWGSPVRAYTPTFDDAFAAKLDAASGALVWNTFLGGSGTDAGFGIAVDGAGDAYVAGSSDSSWGSPVRAYSVLSDAFAAKLDATSGALVWNTFLGGAGSDTGFASAVDGIGGVYVAGTCRATWGSPVRAFTAGVDAFAAKLDATSGALVWNTFLGGAGSDRGSGVAVNGSGNLFVAGTSDATWGSPLRAYTAQNDAFAARLDAVSGTLVWSLFLGGPADDFGNGVAADGSGNAYVAGESEAPWGSPVRPFSDPDEAFAAKIGELSVSMAEIPTLAGAGLAALVLLLAIAATIALRRRAVS